MGITAAAMKHVEWNAVVTFGVALTSGAVTYAVNRMGHATFELPQDIKNTSSAIIRLFAFVSGSAVGLYALSKTNVVVMVPDQTFVSAHALSMLSMIYCSAMAAIVSFSPDKSSTVFYSSFAALTLTTPFVACFGQLALIPAAGIGAAVGSYL
jgi:hypothetical protein